MSSSAAGLCKRLALVGIVVLTLAGPAAAASTTVAIGEFRVRGPNGGSDELVELYNLSSAPQNIGGWRLNGSNNAGTVSTRATVPAGTTIGPRCHYLFTNSSTSGGPYSGAVAGDQTYGTGITDDGGIGLLLPSPDPTIVDQVGLSAGSAYKEGATLASLGSSNLNRSYERGPGGAGGSGTDTDDNASDFALLAPSDPQNRRSSCVGGPTGLGFSIPLFATAGAPVTLGVVVTPGSNPAGTGPTVTSDLTQIGGPANAQFYDDGTHGDDTAGDNTFTLSTVIAAGTPLGQKTLDATIADAQFRFGHAPIFVDVAFTAEDAAPSVTTTSPGAGATDVATDSDVSIAFDEPVDVGDGWFTISCTSSGAHGATASGGPATWTLDPTSDLALGDTCTVTVVAAHVSDQDTIDPPDTMAADYVFSFSTPAPPTRIHDIQGASHTSPRNGQAVTSVPGIVTAKRTNGFYLQDPDPDSSDATSEGVFVFTSSAPGSVAVGDSVRVNGRVSEFRPGGSSSANLTTTELVSPAVTVLSHGNGLPAPVVLGTGGRIPPDQVIEDDASGSVETSGTFDPADDGIDFYESLEGMRVQLNDAIAVGPTNGFGETPVVGDGGAHAGVRTARGGVLLRPEDGNPERLVADDSIVSLPSLNVGDGYSGPLVGVVDYNFGNPFLEVTSAVSRVDNGLQRETTAPAGTGEVAVATFNVENLDPSDQPAKFERLADEVVTDLRSPDLMAVEEVQDDNGPTDDGTVDANQTLDELVAAIQAAGGPTYRYRYIDPVDDQDGGEPGGNIRQVFLFRTDRGLSFVDRPGGTPTTGTGVSGSGVATQLTFSPGRIAPGDVAWTSSRKPLAGEFLYRGHRLFVIANHFNSKGGDDPLFGRFQPPARPSEVQRHQQASLVAGFVSQLTSADPNANVVVLGDLNDFEFSQTVAILEAAGPGDLMNTLPLNQRYSYEFEGNAQVLDHILVGGGLGSRPVAFDPVHVNAEFFDQASDHDPSVARILLNDPPTASAGGPYTVDEGSSVTLTAAGSDPEDGPLTYAWDLDGDGTFETAGQSVAFSPDDGPAMTTVKVKATDDGGLTDVDEETVTVRNVPPTAVFGAPATTPAGFAFALSLSGPHDPSTADTAAGFTYAFDCGSGYGAFGSSSGATCPTSDVGTRSVGGKIRDKDDGVTEYRATVEVFVTFASLCDLVRSYATDPKVADDLCDKLQRAAASPSERAGLLIAFGNQVDAKTGKGLTPEQAETLKRLSMRL
jgi:uncharacterized protein